tara:strand:- start:16938 stop:17312 length:375 start_codon:yes stop_codon:yes gene_type:complete
MKWLLTVLFFMSAAGSCDAAIKEWTEKERKLYHSYLTLSAIDTYQTFKMIDCQKQPSCPFVEMNPIIGSHPSKERLLAVKFIGNAVIYKLLDNNANDREFALKLMNGLQGFVVTHNGIYYMRRF